MNDGRIRVSADDLTLLEHAELMDALEAAGYPTEGAGSGIRVTAAMAWIVRRRTDPTFTLEDAFALKMADLDVVNDADPNPDAAVIGGAPLSSLASGT